MLIRIFAWGFVSLLWFKIALDFVLYPRTLEKIAAGLMGIMTALFMECTSRVYARSPKFLLPIPFLLLTGLYVAIITAITFGFDKWFYGGVVRNAYLDWGKAYYRESFFWFVGMSAVPMIAHFILYVGEAIVRRYNAAGESSKVASAPEGAKAGESSKAASAPEVPAHVVTCLKCGQKNRVPDKRGTAKCAKCKEVIEVNLPRTWRQTLRRPVQILAVAGALLLAIVIQQNMPESPRAIPRPPEQPRAIPRPPARPIYPASEPKRSEPKPVLTPVNAVTGYYRAPAGPRLAPFTIVTKGPYNFFVRLFDADTGKAAAEIYIRGGETFSDKMSLGNYVLRYASGTTWYGRRALFGEDTGRFRAVENFQFQEISNGYRGYTVELYRQPHGNLETVPISEEEFGE